jgi:hypothetical protein
MTPFASPQWSRTRVMPVADGTVIVERQAID